MRYRVCIDCDRMMHRESINDDGLCKSCVWRRSEKSASELKDIAKTRKLLIGKGIWNEDGKCVS